jgi:hypothetical protein
MPSAKFAVSGRARAIVCAGVYILDRIAEGDAEGAALWARRHDVA